MRILILANSDMGLYKFRKELLEYFITKKYQVYISVPDGVFVNDIEKLGCRVVKTKISRHGTNPLEDLVLIKKYKQYMKNVIPNVVLTYTIKPNVYGGMVCASLGIPYVSNITGLGTTIENKGILQVITLNLYRLALRKAQTVFFQNAINEQFFRKKNIAVEKHRMLPGSGVNLNDFKYLEPPKTMSESEKFLFVGRIMKDKGIDELLEAAEKVKLNYPHTEFWIVGFLDGDYEDILKQAQKRGTIQYLGQKSDVRPFYEKCDAVIMPSYHEGMSNVLLEAAACGRPVLASNVPGCKETFDEGITGFGFEPKNAQSLYDAVIRFIELPAEEKITMGKKGREKMERGFNRDIVIAEYMKEIQKADRNSKQHNLESNKN